MTGPVEAARQLNDRTSLRTKLITAVLALVIVALAAISVASVAMLRSYVTTQQDSTLTATFYRYFDSGRLPTPQYPGTGGGQAIAPGEVYTVGANIVAAVQVPGSQVSWDGPNLSETSPPLLPTSKSWASAPNGVLLTLPSQSGPDSWRVIAGTGTYAVNIETSQGVEQEQQTLTLVMAVNLGNINALTTRLVLFDLIVGGAIVLVLAAVGVGVVRANLRPLDDIEMTAGQIAKGHLNHRVPEGDPRTEIGSLGRSLNAMLAQIETAFHAQEEAEQSAHQSEERMRRFIADAAHELRTPLTTIRGFSAHYRQRGGAAGRGRGAAKLSAPEEIQDNALGTVPSTTDAGLTPEELDHLMGRVESEATRMGLLVEDLLTLARLDQQRPLAKAPVDVLTLAVDAVQDARIVAPERSVSLAVEPGVAFLVEGDEARLRQVLANLVNNALTHTPAGTPVRVRIGTGALPSGAPAVELHVADDGPGMTAEQAQRVFERFYRADAARNRASGGTGLGLAIVAGLVNAHGGTVGVKTAPGQGADFQVLLPLSPDAQLDEADEFAD